MTRNEFFGMQDINKLGFNELELLLLYEANGENIQMGRYSKEQIQTAAARLIKIGCLRGIVVSSKKGIWSGVTPYGKFVMEDIKRRNSV